MLVRAYGKPVSNGVADHVTEKTCQWQIGESAVKKDRSTEDGEKNDKISPGCFMQKKSRFLMVWRQGSISVLLPPDASETDITDIKRI